MPEKKEQIDLILQALRPEVPVVVQLSLEDLEKLFEQRQESQDLMTLEELAEAWKVPKSKIYAYTRETGPGSLPRLKLGKYLRFEWEKVQEWLKDQNRDEV